MKTMTAFFFQRILTINDGWRNGVADVFMQRQYKTDYIILESLSNQQFLDGLPLVFAYILSLRKSVTSVKTTNPGNGYDRFPQASWYHQLGWNRHLHKFATSWTEMWDLSVIFISVCTSLLQIICSCALLIYNYDVLLEKYFTNLSEQKLTQLTFWIV